MPDILLAGYVGRSPQALLRLAQEHDALVVDIRYSSRSRSTTWQKRTLSDILGDRFAWYARLGNLRYKEGPPIEIWDMEGGMAYLAECLKQWPCLILLCACKELSTCHRAVVGEACRERGWTVTELDWEAK